MSTPSALPRALSGRLGPALQVAAVLALAAWGSTRPPREAVPPQRLADTNLWSNAAHEVLAPGNLAYSPQYPLWTDGATKRRWIHLPPGSSIDASDPDAWVFPAGTRLWKEFALDGRRVETRTMELAESGRWTYATYLWSADGRDAVRAPDAGLRDACRTPAGSPYDVPGVLDCKACHEGHPTPVLGFGALQLSPDRDPLAPHADVPPPPGSVDLAELVRRGLVRGLPAELLAHPPRVLAATPGERAARGYLHGNCASCHNASGPLASLGLDLEVRLTEPGVSLASALGQPSRFRLPGEDALERIRPGDPDHSLIVRRMASRDPALQMPPMGTHEADARALELVAGWVREALADDSLAARTHDLLSHL